VIVQHNEPSGNAGAPAMPRVWPFWLLLVLFEASLWLLLSSKFGQPSAVVALAVGLAMGVAVQMAGLHRWRGALWALGLTVVTVALALYGQAALHVARVLGLSPLEALAGTGMAFARLVLEGLLTASDWWLIGGGIALAILFGYGLRLPRRRSSAGAP
jgi:hypothetical protein